MNNISAVLSAEVISALISGYFQELGLLSPVQELHLTALILENNEVSIEADVIEDTLQ